jgi:transcription-repair coupling factor (superfamily II helicase)
MRDMAEELLKLYAARQMAEASPMAEDSDLQRQFEAAFSFDETPDQLEAIGAIKNDLESSRPMDRLLCGDVGFGKTEVAIRAAFKAVDNGFQVAILAPTTILADQHLETFRKRFRDFPIRVEMVSRFCTPAEIRDTRQRLAEGTVDIVIGTHRLLGKTFDIPKLGLIIVDEEQRFGVAHKERLKHMRKNVHVLSMSATPVPRTLQLSLAGVRELSLIETPPRDRMAVETAIVPFDAQLIREALIFEKERGGQIFYVYNEVDSIERMSSYLRELMPDLRITVGHGQMDERELARRMHAFVAGEYDLLLATTIIENGIDIPNVNTMIVHDAQRFGLSQLYQLRGRVGRSDQLAYCYLLVPQDRVLSEQARKRLAAIREFTELGAGFRVAGRDLEIRGAGNLLGAEQSGHIGAVGIETYLRMLEETVAELRGETVPEALSVTMDLPVPIAIPQTYIEDANLRMEVYHRIVTGDATEDEILAELRDRFGTPPEAVHGFIQVVLLKRLAEDLRLQSIAARKGTLYLRLRQDARLAPERLIEWVSSQPGARFSPDGVLSLEGVAATELVKTARATLEALAA